MCNGLTPGIGDACYEPCLEALAVFWRMILGGEDSIKYIIQLLNVGG